jgi:DNA-directed RNA polymerase specialized sigma24 family protein
VTASASQQIWLVVDQTRQMVRDSRLTRIERLYERDFVAFVRVARGIVGDRERALEAVHDGFVDAIRARASLRSEAALDAWVWRAVVNAARKARRRPLVEPAREPEPVVEPPPPHTVAPALAQLPERQRLVVFLRYYADLDYRRIAEVLDVEVGTVSAALAAAHRSVRRLMEEVEVG